MRRAIACACAAILVWSVQDILIWQRVFEARHLYQYDGIYQFWHYAFLIALLVGGAAYIRGWWALWFAASTWTLANSGLADVLYYWLDGRALPRTLPWLDDLHPLLMFHPATAITVLASALGWIAVWTATLLALVFVSRVKWRSAS